MRAQMLFRHPPAVLPVDLIVQRLFDRIGQRQVTLVLEDNRVWTSRLQESAALGDNRSATARNSFQCNEAERLLPTGRHNDHSMSIQLLHERFAGLRAKKRHLICELKL